MRARASRAFASCASRSEADSESLLQGVAPGCEEQSYPEMPPECGAALSQERANAGAAKPAAKTPVNSDNWEDYLVEGEDKSKKPDVARAKARMRREKRVENHKQKKGQKWQMLS